MKNNIGIIGLGYVGLPLAIAFSKHFNVTGFDINSKRINDLNNNLDLTNEVSFTDLKDSEINFTCNEDELKNISIFIITVPTPLGKYNEPDITILLEASKIVGKNLSKDNIVIYESTVYPGCTEEDCIPILEKESKLKYNRDFFCGYSPERINPGDKTNRLENIKKVVSGSNYDTTIIVENLYNKIIKAGVHVAPNIKTAEASKAIENAQRDLNISFVNELAIIFDLFNLDTTDVLDCASSKWNFLDFKPGLVGGHCIGVDPFYLSKKSEQKGYVPEVITSGRKINNYIPKFIVDKCLRLAVKNEINLKNVKVLILGITFKENCPDIRNSKVFDLFKEFKVLNFNVDIYDSYANKEEVFNEYGIKLIEDLNLKYDIIVHAVSHEDFKNINYLQLKNNDNSIIFDVKSSLPKNIINGRL